ncbi:restriction endonuclease subunit S [Salicibibacter cibi]|uniref:Restriction endonuclease subunit S n=1 Tax=Salicibibacter cibi TaxID=2743001 RepID=A0A7T6ZCG0_9BACI|nr:restriction endonuclease subunit S [Salicibibacter cibi]QQK80725.1 restriction endonuclease subunit S [Salicibibacter cibi]
MLSKEKFIEKHRRPFSHPLPDQWGYQKIGNHLKESKEKNREKLPLYSVTMSQGIVPQELSNKRDISSVDKSRYKVIEPNDIVYNTMRMWQGVVGLSDVTGIVSPAYTVCQLSEGIYGKYVEFLFKSRPMINLFHRFSQGLVSDTLNLKYSHLKDILMPIPPLPEQRKIAAILTSVDNAIEKTEAIIAQTEKVKNGLMQKLLTQGIGHTKFKQTEIGEIPEEWEIVTLDRVVTKLFSGVSVNSEDRIKKPHEKGILKTSAVTNRIFNALEHKTILPLEEERAAVTPKKNHIVISRMNTPLLVGASSYVDKDHSDLYLPDRLWQAETNNNVISLWLSYVLTWNKMRSIISSISTGTSGSMKNISQKALLNLKISLPSLSEQENISQILVSVDNKITAEQQKMTQLQTLKKGLMQVLLTGKVRVKVDEEDEVVST